MDLNEFRNTIMPKIREAKEAYARKHGVKVSDLPIIQFGGNEMQLTNGTAPIENGTTTARPVSVERTECIIRMPDPDEFNGTLSDIGMGWCKQLVQILRENFNYCVQGSIPGRKMLLFSNTKSNLTIDTVI